MEKKTIDTLRVMLCGEIDEIAKKGSLSKESLDSLKDLVETEKNLCKIEKHMEEREEIGGYSQRKYYIDADYQPTNSYNRGRMGGDYNSYMYYDPRYSMARGYSGHGKEEIVNGLHAMMNEATDDKSRMAIQEAIAKIG